MLWRSQTVRASFVAWIKLLEKKTNTHFHLKYWQRMKDWCQQRGSSDWSSAVVTSSAVATSSVDRCGIGVTGLNTRETFIETTSILFVVGHYWCGAKQHGVWFPSRRVFWLNKQLVSKEPKTLNMLITAFAAFSRLKDAAMNTVPVKGWIIDVWASTRCFSWHSVDGAAI